MDPEFFPAPPREAYFDPARGTWILSRYVDVYAALREPALGQVSAHGEFLLAQADAETHSRLFSEVQADMSRLSSAEWLEQMKRAAASLIERAQTGRPVDVVRDVIQPWSTAMLLALHGTKPERATRLETLATRLFFRIDRQGPATIGKPIAYVARRWRALHRRRAQAELNRLSETQELTVSKPMLTGLTQTLPSFLAKAWLALLENPDQSAVLRADPERMPGAVEELLRYAGIVHTLYRRAHGDVQIGEIRIARDQKVMLRLGSANYDPEQFSEPQRLDVTRRRAGHLGLGTGAHSCVGAVLVRMATAAITPVFLASEPVLEAGEAVVWTGDNTLRWPITVSARLVRREATS